MKKPVTWMALAALTILFAPEAANAAPRHYSARGYHNRPAAVAQGYYEGDREFRIDRNDRASSPY